MSNKKESTYKLRKRIKELERKCELYRVERNQLQKVVESIFDSLTNCKENQYIPPLVLIKHLKPLLYKIRTCFD